MQNFKCIIVDCHSNNVIFNVYIINFFKFWDNLQVILLRFINVCSQTTFALALLKLWLLSVTSQVHRWWQLVSWLTKRFNGALTQVPLGPKRRPPPLDVAAESINSQRILQTDWVHLHFCGLKQQSVQLTLCVGWTFCTWFLSYVLPLLSCPICYPSFPHKSALPLHFLASHHFLYDYLSFSSAFSILLIFFPFLSACCFSSLLLVFCVSLIPYELVWFEPLHVPCLIDSLLGGLRAGEYWIFNLMLGGNLSVWSVSVYVCSLTFKMKKILYIQMSHPL